MAGQLTRTAEVVRQIRDALDLDLRADQPFGQGQGRVYLCRLGDATVVVKWGLDPDLAEKIPYVASQVDELARRGCQVPTIVAHGPLAGQGYAWVQQRLPGEPATMLDAALLSDLVELTARWADAPAGAHRGSYTDWVPAVVFEDEAGWWATARSAGPAAAALASATAGSTSPGCCTSGTGWPAPAGRDWCRTGRIGWSGSAATWPVRPTGGRRWPTS